MNIKIEHPWEVTAGDQYGQKVDLDIVSGDIPDAFKVNAKQLARLAEEDLLEGLRPYWDEFASPLVKEIQASAEGVALERATIDGKLLAVPGVVKDGDAVPFLWVRSDWLETLGLELPSTLEEVKAVTKAFVENDASGQGDTIGIGAEALWTDSLGPIFNARKLIPREYVPSAEGEPTYGTIEPETKEALATVGLFSMVGHWNAYFDGLIYMQSPDKYPLQTYIQQLAVLPPTDMDPAARSELLQSQTFNKAVLDAAKLVVAMVPILLVYPFLQRYFIHRLTIGSLKE